MEATVKRNFDHQRNDWKPRAEDRWDRVEWKWDWQPILHHGGGLAAMADGRLVLYSRGRPPEAVSLSARDADGWRLEPSKADYSEDHVREWGDQRPWVRFRWPHFTPHGPGKPVVRREKVERAWSSTGYSYENPYLASLRVTNHAPCKGRL